MTDHKFTDDEIIKALECCNTPGSCYECPYDGINEVEYDDMCTQQLIEDIFPLINRQKIEIEALKIANEKMYAANKEQEAEIERLESLTEQLGNDVDVKLKYIYELEEQLKTAKSEAIKEFAERLKEKMYPYNGLDKRTYAINARAVEKAIEDLVKEMMENDK